MYTAYTLQTRGLSSAYLSFNVKNVGNIMFVTIPRDIRAQLFMIFEFPRPRLRRMITRLLYYNIGNNYFLTSCLPPRVSLAFCCHTIYRCMIIEQYYYSWFSHKHNIITYLYILSSFLPSPSIDDKNIIFVNLIGC